MTKIYAVLVYREDPTRAEFDAVFSTKEKAHQYILLVESSETPRWEVQEWNVDDISCTPFRHLNGGQLPPLRPAEHF